MAQPYQFAYSSWVLQYPELGAVQQGNVEGLFPLACLYWRNDGSSPNPDDGSQALLLNMLVAHIVSTKFQSGTDPSPGQPKEAGSPVGRISQAAQGSVNATIDLNLLPGQAAWFSQTKYGLDFWQATAGYRLAKYVPGRLQPGGLWPSAGWGPGRRWGL